ncbi:hypothetical protein MOV66_10175 [Agrobacterium sp. SHOUNA12C]|nr:hypothetical protein [Agrobacterium sp. BETTINA12B]MCJ9757009.1 hypothetical protein [Agrobacterium sp. SHOUNA12C]
MPNFDLTPEQVTVLVGELSADVVASLFYQEGELIVPDEHSTAVQQLIDGMEVPTALAVLKVQLKTSIDVQAEAARLNYITPGTGQAMTYQQKASEAAGFLAATNPVASDYPLLSAEVGITAADIAGVAQVVSAAYAQWQVIGAAIESVRLGTKAVIEAAATEDAANAAFRAAHWP